MVSAYASVAIPVSLTSSPRWLRTMKYPADGRLAGMERIQQPSTPTSSRMAVDDGVRSPWALRPPCASCACTAGTAAARRNKTNNMRPIASSYKNKTEVHRCENLPQQRAGELAGDERLQ